MNIDSGKSRDFKEITLAITILTGLSYVLFKIADYFNNNTIGLSDNLQSLVFIFVSGLLIEFAIISSFLILKGYLLFTATREKATIIADAIFNYFFLYFVFLGVYSIFLLFFIIISSPTLIESPYYIYFFYVYIVLTVYATVRVVSYLGGFNRDDFIKSAKKFPEILGNLVLKKVLLLRLWLQHLF